MGRGIALVVAITLLVLPTALTVRWMNAAEARLVAADAAPGATAQVAHAEEANEAYCTPALKQILRRVLASCGLLGGGGEGRGCQPLEAKNVATMEDSDFNALFVPMRARGGIVQFELGSSGLSDGSRALVDQVFAERGGASYFFVVARASQDGTTEYNRKLSEQRASAVMSHLHQTFDDPELDRRVGLLWLGEEYAQLDPSFCDWTRSGDAARCKPEELNRSAFLAWIECRL